MFFNNSIWLHFLLGYSRGNELNVLQVLGRFKTPTICAYFSLVICLHFFKSRSLLCIGALLSVQGPNRVIIMRSMNSPFSPNVDLNQASLLWK
jgi:hypothetical protein